MYDSGNICVGSRKVEEAFTRVVEYDISFQSRRPSVRSCRAARTRVTLPWCSSNWCTKTVDTVEGTHAHRRVAAERRYW